MTPADSDTFRRLICSTIRELGACLDSVESAEEWQDDAVASAELRRGEVIANLEQAVEAAETATRHLQTLAAELGQCIGRERAASVRSAPSALKP